MGDRVRGRNGAERRYKGPRELVGTRIPPRVTDRVDSERDALGLTRNDYLFAAILVALDNPDAIRHAAGGLRNMARPRRCSEAGQPAADAPQEVFA